jgi:hypothetical protein
MFVQRARQAHARSSPSEGKRETHGLLTTEGNFFYRPGSAAWYSWKDENGRGGQWPVVITRILAPPMRPDIVEVACRALYSGDYFASSGLDPYIVIPPNGRGKNVWYLTDIVINLPSDRINSKWTAALAYFDSAAELRRQSDGKRLISTNDELGADPNGFGQEHLIIAGTVTTARKTSKYYWKEQVKSLVPAANRPALLQTAQVSFNELLGEDSITGQSALPTRPPWSSLVAIPAVPRVRFVHDNVVFTAEYDPSAGAFEARLLDEHARLPGVKPQVCIATLEPAGRRRSPATAGLTPC